MTLVGPSVQTQFSREAEANPLASAFVGGQFSEIILFTSALESAFCISPSSSPSPFPHSLFLPFLK